MWHFSKVGLLRQFLEWLESGEETEAGLLEICLGRIREADSEIQAWVRVSPQPRCADGPLRGVPFGVKDIFDTEGLPTEFGSPLYAGRQPETDAALVRAFKQRGAVLVGKTHTTAFAYFDPAPTRNPRDTARTPGGSSSGSAAAVAAGMVPLALGTQTQGSVLRPASYCGVACFKPTYGILPLQGALAFAPTLDTAGLFTQTADDMLLVGKALGWDCSDAAPLSLGVPPLPTETMPEMEGRFCAAVAKLRAEGFRVQAMELPPSFRELLPAARLINDYEGARTHQERWKKYGGLIGRRLADLVKRGLAIRAEEYVAALDTLERARRQIAGRFEETPVILFPAATGPAPRGLDSTGDPCMNTPWTALGGPAISIPMPGPGLPLGLQLTAARNRDGFLLAAAAMLERSLNRPLKGCEHR